MHSRISAVLIFKNAATVLARIIHHFREEPLAAFLTAATREVDFEDWWKTGYNHHRAASLAAEYSIGRMT